ncbi:bacterial extracellular solute-binding protein [Paenibacillus sp. 32O-W]|uniref:ABC transporter substrate-binding protein n=1 Tax=Paenibacillus cisolokensis TaxID=1658519 RepID=A0ABQ4N288_9BACL|nr:MULTISPECIES: sugar ABC transporter substrate-binding protein [Paenibacillus]ALS29865.1 bacterial extracellular solute-binding protein [Paenibacillus sp. 32O-W]GIQ62319.1 ABC transporter substrate-binding protein [Paenibacillus cisolokensis]
MRQAKLIILPGVFILLLFSVASAGAPSGGMSDKHRAAANPEAIESELTLWAWGYTAAAIAAELPGFHEAYPGIRVRIEVKTHDDMYKKLLLANASNEGGPDVAALSGYYVGQYIETNALEDLSGRIAPYRDKIVAAKWPDAMRDGRYYAMPWDSGPVALFYRRDLFAEAGLPSDPESVSRLLATWDGYLEAGRTIKERTGAFMHTMPLESTFGLTVMWEHMLAQEGMLYVDEDGAIRIDRPEALRALKQLLRMIDEGIVLDAETRSQTWNEALAEGKIATVLEAVWMGAFLKDTAPESAGLWGVARMPAWTEGGSRAAEAGGSYLGIMRQSDNKEAAWAFIEYMLGNSRTVNRMYRYADIFPSLKEAYRDPMYDEPEPFFGNQKTRRLFVELANESRPVYFSHNFRAVRDIARIEMFKAIKGRITPEQALMQMQQKMAELTKPNRKPEEG